MKSCRSLNIASLVGLLGALSMGACTDDSASLHVLCPIVPEVRENSCFYDPEGDECVLRGVLNVDVASQYDSALRVESGLKPRESDSPPRAEVNRILLTGGEVEIRKPSGAPLKFDGLPNPYPVIGSGYADPDSRGVMRLTLIPGEYVDQLRQNAASDAPLREIVLAVTVMGKTDGQVEAESAEWLWPVTLTGGSAVETDGQCSRQGTVCGLGSDFYASACVVCFDNLGEREPCEPR